MFTGFYFPSKCDAVLLMKQYYFQNIHYFNEVFTVLTEGERKKISIGVNLFSKAKKAST
jgi:hypothetical protein